jgi:hypothetical protein
MKEYFVNLQAKRKDHKRVVDLTPLKIKNSLHKKS